MKRYIPILLALLLMAGCEREEPAPTVTPTPTPTPTSTLAPEEDPNLRGISLDVGDGIHSFWVEARYSGEFREDFPESDMGLTLSFYERKGDPQPVQVIETGTMQWNERFRLEAVDADFDGNMDLYYTYSEGTHGNGFRSFYIWDQDSETFIPDPYGLDGLMSASIDEKNRAVVECQRGVDFEWERFYRYTFLEKELYLCRELYYSGWDGSSEMRVTEYEYDGEGQTLVFTAESPETFSGPEYEEFCRWRDLGYWGKREVKVDGTHTFWVELVDTEKYGTLLVNIYKEKTDREPVQTFEDQYDCLFEETHFFVEDVDFDGDMDFYFMTAKGHFSVSLSSYYIWDGEKFVPDPYGLNKVCYANFHPETKVVESIRVSSIASSNVELYRYIDGELTRLRRLERWEPSGNEQKLMVHDWKDGEWIVAYETVIDIMKWEPGEEFDPEFSRWYDLDYHGKQ